MASSDPEIMAEESKSVMVDDVMPIGTEKYESTSDDVRDMWRMGKIQELKVSIPR